MGVEVAVKAKIPFTGIKKELTISAETSHNWAYGSENSVTNKFKGSTPVSVPAGKVYEGVA